MLYDALERPDWIPTLLNPCSASGPREFRKILTILSSRKQTHDSEAPTKLLTVQYPSLVLIFATSPDSLSTQAASSEGKVVNPGWTASKIFFLGLRTSRGVASADRRGQTSQ
jgi:hypothetical protein